jgi:hypothetical protein
VRFGVVVGKDEVALEIERPRRKAGEGRGNGEAAGRARYNRQAPVSILPI